jgi:hypothetical protein
VQIRYTRLNGMQCVRVISRSQVCADRLYASRRSVFSSLI